MSYYNILTYVVTGLDMCANDIAHTFTRYVLSKFPHNTFKQGSVYIDTMGLVNDHKRREDGLKGPSKVIKPIVTVTIDGGLTDVWAKDDGAPDVKQFSMFPGTTTDRRIVNNHRLALIADRKTGVYVDTIELWRKLELDFKFEFDSKADLNVARGNLYNTLSIRKNSILDSVKTNIILPNSLISDISRLAFNRDEFSLSNDNDIIKLKDYMNYNGIHNIYVKNNDTDENIVWFLMDRIFKMNYYVLEMEQKDGSSADKNGEVYDKFTLDLRCTLNFKLPNSYIMNYKIFNAPNKALISNEYFNNTKLDKDANLPASFSEAKYIEDRACIKPVDPGFELIVREEFLIDHEKELLQLSSFFTCNSIYREILQRLTIKERAKMFEVHIYENGSVIEDSSIKMKDISSDIVFIMDNCDTEVSYMIYIYCNVDLLNRYKTIIKDRITKSIFPNCTEDGIPFVIGSIPPRGLNIDHPYEEWLIDFEYLKNDIIVNNNIVYKAISDNIGIIPDSDELIWKKLAKIWSIDDICYKGEYIIYNSLLYVVLEECIGINPTKDQNKFMFIMVLGCDAPTDFIPVSTEASIGGKFLHGGYGRKQNKVNELKYFDCNIIALRNIAVI